MVSTQTLVPIGQEPPPEEKELYDKLERKLEEERKRIEEEKSERVDRPPNVWCDPNTKLCWQQNVEDRLLGWEEASNYCRELVVGDFTDWYLPNVDDLRSLISGCPDSEGSDAGLLGCYWSDFDSSEDCRCPPGAGKGNHGCYLPGGLAGRCDRRYWSSTMLGVEGNTTCYGDYRRGNVGCGPPSERGYVRCAHTEPSPNTQRHGSLGKDDLVKANETNSKAAPFFKPTCGGMTCEEITEYDRRQVETMIEHLGSEREKDSQ